MVVPSTCSQFVLLSNSPKLLPTSSKFSNSLSISTLSFSSICSTVTSFVIPTFLPSNLTSLPLSPLVISCSSPTCIVVPCLASLPIFSTCSIWFTLSFSSSSLTLSVFPNDTLFIFASLVTILVSISLFTSTSLANTPILSTDSKSSSKSLAVYSSLTCSSCVSTTSSCTSSIGSSTTSSTTASSCTSTGCFFFSTTTSSFSSIAGCSSASSCVFSTTGSCGIISTSSSLPASSNGLFSLSTSGVTTASCPSGIDSIGTKPSSAKAVVPALTTKAPVTIKVLTLLFIDNSSH